MSVKRQSLGQQVDDHKEGEGDAVDYSSDFSSSSSTDSTSLWDSNSFQLSEKKQVSNTSKGNNAKKAQASKQKTSCSANHSVLKSPPIKPLQGPKPRFQSAHVCHVKDLSSQVWDLQRQLSEVTTENKLLKTVQHRQTVALQHCQDSGNTLPQVLAKHSSEVRALEHLLRSTRMSRDSLARKLRATEDELLHTKDSLHNLQLLSQDRSLLERQELTQRLAKATAELDRKNKKIQDTERELDTHKIYCHRLPKGGNIKGRKTKTVPTDELFSLDNETAGHSELQYSKTEEGLEEKQSVASRKYLATEYPDPEDSAVDKSEDGDLGDNEQRAAEHSDTGQQNGCSDQNPEPEAEGGSTGKNEATNLPLAAEREQTEAGESSYTLGNSLNTTLPNSKGLKFPRTPHHYKFKQTIKSMQSGKPAYNSLNKSPHECNMNQMELENLSTGTRKPSFMRNASGVEQQALNVRKDQSKTQGAA